MYIHVYIAENSQFAYFKHICSGTHFHEMRYAIHKSLEDGEYGSRFPVLLRTPANEYVFSGEQHKTLKYLKTAGKELDLSSIPFDDKETYKLISAGNTSGVYLFEDEGMKNLLK